MKTIFKKLAFPWFISANHFLISGFYCEFAEKFDLVLYTFVFF
jgi:hypothetical protein